MNHNFCKINRVSNLKKRGKMKKALLIFILLFVITGCSEDSSVATVATEGTIVVQNAMTSGNTIEQFGVAPVGETVYDQLGGTIIDNNGTFSLYGVTDCNMDLDIRWVESSGYAGVISNVECTL